jgi:hypothetical protein
LRLWQNSLIRRNVAAEVCAGEINLLHGSEAGLGGFKPFPERGFAL